MESDSGSWKGYLTKTYFNKVIQPNLQFIKTRSKYLQIYVKRPILSRCKHAHSISHYSTIDSLEIKIIKNVPTIASIYYKNNKIVDLIKLFKIYSSVNYVLFCL